MPDIFLRSGAASPNDVVLRDPTSTAVTGTGAVAFSFAEALVGAQTIGGTSASTYLFSVAATGTETITGTGASALGFAESLSGAETISGIAAVAFAMTEAATGTETLAGTAAEQFAFAVAGTGTETIAGTGGATFAFALAAAGETIGESEIAPEGTGVTFIGGPRRSHQRSIRFYPIADHSPLITGTGGVSFRLSVAAVGSTTDDELVLLLAA